jgi:hypothetical protein
VIDEKYDDCTNDGDEHRSQIEMKGIKADEPFENESSYNRANQSKRDVEKTAFASRVDNLGGDEARNQPKENPAK